MLNSNCHNNCHCLSRLPLAGAFPKLSDKSPLDVGPADPGANKETLKPNLH